MRLILPPRLHASVILVFGSTVGSTVLRAVTLHIQNQITNFVHSTLNGNFQRSIASPVSWSCSNPNQHTSYHILFSPTLNAIGPTAIRSITFDMISVIMEGLVEVLVVDGVNRFVGSFSIYDTDTSQLLGTGEYVEGSSIVSILPGQVIPGLPNPGALAGGQALRPNNGG